MTDTETAQQLRVRMIKSIESLCWRELQSIRVVLVGASEKRVKQFASTREIFGYLYPQRMGIHEIGYVCADEEHFYHHAAHHDSLHQYEAPLQVLLQVFFMLDVYIMELSTMFTDGQFSTAAMIHASSVLPVLSHHRRHDHDWREATYRCALEKIWQVGVYKAVRADPSILWPDEYHPRQMPKHLGPIPKPFKYTVPH